MSAAHAYGTQERMATLERRAQALRKCAEQGMTRLEAAAALGLGYNTIKRLAARLKLQMAPAPSSVPGRTRATSGAKPATLAPRVDRTEGTPRRCLCGCGVSFLSVHVGERISPRCRAAWSER